MTISTVQSTLLSSDDRARVEETLIELEKNGDLPEAVREPFFTFLRLVADGRSATVLESEAFLTSTEAAEVLSVSRPFLNKLLDEGRIPFHLTGRDRRIACSDIIAFMKQREALKAQRVEAAQTYESRRAERIAVIAGVAADEAQELGFS